MPAAKPVTIRGVWYPSCSAAARALGKSPQAIQQARQRGTLDRVGSGTPPTCPVVIRGQWFPSQMAAARALGVKQSSVWCALERGTIDNVGACNG